MDPFTIALAVFGVSKLTGSSTKNALKNALLAGTGSYAVGAATSAGYLGGAEGVLGGIGTGEAFSGITSLLGPATTAPTASTTGATVGTGLTTGAADTAVGITTSPNLGGVTGLPNPYYQAVTPEKTGFFGGLSDAYSKLGTAEKIGLGAAGVTLAGSLGEEEEPFKRPAGMSDEDYAKAMEEARTQVKDIGRRAPYTASTSTSPYNYGQGSLYTFNQGGIVSVMPKFSEGGVNYLPSKITHNENDIHNYVRATGYVEDGSGNGDKDEDTILAQLADGEFVSRSDAVLGAGILSGANPESYKDMRRKGAAYFYDQQAKFKRIFDLIDASKQTA
jgi:hypothetical protein